MRNEPVASIIQEALEGFASGRFRSQVEVKRFPESQPAFPKGGASGYVHPSKVTDILQRAVYAGCVEAPDWGVTIRKGHHEALISFETFERIQNVLKGVVYAPARKDINEDFPLRGFVACDDCGEPMTSCWSKGRNKLYSYYLCDTKGCVSKRKSIRRDEIEHGAEGILRSLQPAKQLVAMARAMFTDLWEMRLSEAKNAKETLNKQLKTLDGEVKSLLGRIVQANSPTVIRAYEARIEELELQRLKLADKINSALPAKGHLSEFIEPAIQFLTNPWNLYKKGDFAMQQTVLRLTFAEPLRYSRNEGYRTAETTFPFKVLAGFSTP